MQQLADLADVNSRTVYRLENAGEILVSAKKRHGHVEMAVWSRIVNALAARGVEFVQPTVGHGGGVVWSSSRQTYT